VTGSTEPSGFFQMIAMRSGSASAQRVQVLDAML